MAGWNKCEDVGNYSIKEMLDIVFYKLHVLMAFIITASKNVVFVITAPVGTRVHWSIYSRLVWIGVTGRLVF